MVGALKADYNPNHLSTFSAAWIFLQNCVANNFVEIESNLRRWDGGFPSRQVRTMLSIYCQPAIIAKVNWRRRRMNNWQMNELVNHIRKLITQYSEGTFPLSFKLRFSTYQGCTYCRVIVGLSWIWGVYCQAHTVALQKFQLLSKIVVIVNIWGVYWQAHTVTL